MAILIDFLVGRPSRGLGQCVEGRERRGGERRARILGLLVGSGDGAFGTKRLCQVCAEATAPAAPASC